MEATRPQAVYLIGSLARGDAQADSAIDLFVIVHGGPGPSPWFCSACGNAVASMA